MFIARILYIIIFINKSSIEKHAIKYIRNLGIDYSIHSQKQIKQIQVIGDGREWERIVSIHGTNEIQYFSKKFNYNYIYVRKSLQFPLLL